VLGDLGSPFAREPDVVAYDRHILFASDDPTGAARHRAPGPISTTRIEEAFVHELPEELVGLVFAQADALSYACDLGVGVYLIPSAWCSGIALSIALRWWSANSVGTTLPFRSSAAYREATSQYRDPPPPTPLRAAASNPKVSLS
jgi:hypothetical protein